MGCNYYISESAHTMRTHIGKKSCGAKGQRTSTFTWAIYLFELDELAKFSHHIVDEYNRTYTLEEFKTMLTNDVHTHEMHMVGKEFS